MSKVIIIGASGHAKVIIEAIEFKKQYEIFGLVDSYKEKGEKLMNHEILGSEYEIPNLMEQGITKGVIAIGDNWTRLQMYNKIKTLAPDFEFVTVVHHSAIVSSRAKIGKGTVILTGVKINTDARVGNFCILNTNSSLDHDCDMHDFSSIAPGVTVGGNVKIDFCTAICLGANIIQGVHVGEHTIVGAGSLITKNVDSFKLVYGVPGKEIKTIEKGQKYISKS
ncbi:acetyltransferase [Aquimarina sp. U1-2]|uniref:acetyltransferase n=1 Tax=Aquimarina sp. U1-2 TaxID=2823141 RepID=UPI001AECE4E9|nr:acetyltransferase [Aquimarina sp. U1-2]MBP2832006.1 acetyltransferase [Aquimarina sp. U1-2]